MQYFCLQIFQYGIDPINTTITLLPTTQIRVNEVATTEHEFTLSAYDISDEDLVTINPEEDIDLEQWIRELFRDEPWFVNGNFWSPDTILSVNKNFMILSGVSCNCFLIWDYKTGQLVNKVLLPAGYQLSWNVIDFIATFLFILGLRKKCIPYLVFFNIV